MQTAFRHGLLAVFLVATVGNTACTSMASIDATPEAVVANDIQPGDKVKLVLKTGQSHDITVDDISQSAIAGTTDNGQQITAAFGDIRTIEARKFDGQKTAKYTAKGFGYAVLGVLFIGAAAAEVMSGAYGQ